MAIERGVTVRQVEDEPGAGFFQTTIEEGGVERQDRVPALYIEGGNKAEQAYVQQQLETGIPVVAYRAGERGMCTVAVNYDVVAVETARRFNRLDTWGKKFVWIELNPADNYERFIEPDSQGGNAPKIEFTGTNKQTGAPIKITVGFVR